jgi:hypothetical protein
MTRINCGISPKQLSRLHLLAEHREIKRIPNAIKKKKGIVDFNKIPKEFCLGKGHVTFFYNKLKYLYKRYREIYRECEERGYNVTDFSESFEGMSDDLNYHLLWNDYQPLEKDIQLIKQRIKERS